MKSFFVIAFVSIEFLVLAGPARIIDLSCRQTNAGVVLTWTAPIPSGVTTLTNISVRYSTSPINTLNWDSASEVSWLTDPGTPDTTQVAVITSELAPITTYYFAIKTQDSDGIWSTMSNMAFIASGDSVSSVSLAWDPSTESNIVSYQIRVGTLPGGPYDEIIETGLTTTCTVSNRVWGITYYFVCTATNSEGLSSDYSNEVSYSVR